MSATLDGVTVTASDFAASLAFYDAALEALGLVRIDELVDEEEDDGELEAVAWGRAGGPAFLWLISGAAATTGVHLRVRADSRLDVETFHEAGVRHGGESRSAPRRWTPYRRGEFNAVVADPDGNLIEAVSPE